MKRIRVASAIVCAAWTWNACAADLKLSSPGIAAGQTLKDAYVLHDFGCAGANLSPALAWADAPAGTQSFAVTVYDPDAPTGSGWWHWVVYDIPSTTHNLAEGVGHPTGSGLPQGAIQGRNDFGSYGYGGACPPAGDKPHRYIFTVYALKIGHLGVAKDASPAMIGFMVHANTLATSSIQTFYAH